MTASCSHEVEQYSLLETFSDPSLVLSVTSPQYSPQHPPASSPWCLHPDCLPVRGISWLAANNITYQDCVEEEPGAAWCIGDPTVLQWEGGHFVLSDQSYGKYTSDSYFLSKL